MVESRDGELDVLRPGVLETGVGEPAEALDEQHHGRNACTRHLGRVVGHHRRVERRVQ